MSSPTEYPRYSAKIDTNSHGEVLVGVEVNGNDIDDVKRETAELYSHITEELSAYGCKLPNPNELDTQIDTTAKGDPLVKVTGKGFNVVTDYLVNLAKLHNQEAIN